MVQYLWEMRRGRRSWEWLTERRLLRLSGGYKRYMYMYMYKYVSSHNVIIIIWLQSIHTWNQLSYLKWDFDSTACKVKTYSSLQIELSAAKLE